MHRKHWVKILGGLAILVGGGRRGYQTFIQNSSQSDEYISNDMVVGTGDIVNALTMNGRAKFSNMQKLTFPQSGRITAVYKKVGDIVKEGEIIAKMDTYEIDNELEQAKIDLENQQTSLKKAFDSSKRELEIMQAEKAYSTLLYGQKNADASLKLALQTIENTYINKKNEYLKMLRDYEKKQKDYETKQKTYNEIISLDKSATILHADEILKSKLEDLQFTADALRKEMDVLDKFMHYSDKYGRTQPEYLIYIGAKDASTKNAVETLFWKVLTAATNLSARAGSGQLSKLPEVELKSKLIQQYELLKETADIKTELSLMVDKMFEASIESVGTSRSAVSIGDGRTLKATAKTAIDEIL
ncbi:MAG: efflux RND transporter periplasmic adaptor subunit [Candidatus Peribacteria bacterium]|jgi:multidrug efflux pump subunit AcrA (membrane-fusion protein)|nr:efflux RND transporter periplasmic adaptor subunit [Candidatus Peribacteria bacterium]